METLSSSHKNRAEAEKVLNAKILELTMLIKEKYPELYGFLGEMPATIPDDSNPDINDKALQEYYDSLEAMVKQYTVEHPLV